MADIPTEDQLLQQAVRLFNEIISYDHSYTKFFITVCVQMKYVEMFNLKVITLNGGDFNEENVQRMNVLLNKMKISLQKMRNAKIRSDDIHSLIIAKNNALVQIKNILEPIYKARKFVENNRNQCPEPDFGIPVDDAVCQPIENMDVEFDTINTNLMKIDSMINASNEMMPPHDGAGVIPEQKHPRYNKINDLIRNADIMVRNIEQLVNQRRAELIQMPVPPV